ncbi:FMN-dependent NADH-azoreductase [Pseudomonas sp. 2835]|uniref:FMN-dependent NADH-azoreductase n=1 Tax=Pseudomonas sp. 2835 TaxID=3156451 RepID=UPI003D1CE6D9
MNHKVLVIRSSIKTDGGFSGQLVDNFLAELKEVIPEASIVVRDLHAQPIPHLNAVTMDALYGGDASSAEASAALKLSNELIEELQEADRVVIGLPRYNFGAPSILHAWVDYLVRAGVTFNYVDGAPVGLINDKPVHVLNTSGGVYSQGSDSLAGWLSQTLGFIGLQQVEFIYAEGLGMGEESLANGLAAARRQIQHSIESMGARPRLSLAAAQGR